MKTKPLPLPQLAAVVMLLCLMVPVRSGYCQSANEPKRPGTVRLPQPRYDSRYSIERALNERRSVRNYANEALSLFEVSQLLWAAQGITEPAGYRTAPSAGALYPLEIYLVAGSVRDLPAGVYRYAPGAHELRRTDEGDVRHLLARAALRQGAVRHAPAVLVFCAEYRRTTVKYGQRGVRYVFMEIGHASQNVCLQAAALGLGSVTIGAFDDRDVKKILKCPDEEEVLYLMPVGRRIERSTP